MNPEEKSRDERHMRNALRLAGRGLGRVAPNPAVGCVIVKAGQVIGRGWTQDGGRPHAETVALQRAGEEARGATAYVTLEPCAHHGKTPPCAEALIKAGLARVVIALRDPDERVNGLGIEMLQKAGVRVTESICAEAAAELNAGFIMTRRQGRPLVTLKMATSLDGRIATASGDSKWITSPAARRFGHLLRAQNDAIMVGVNTVLVDNPELTCRIDGLTQHSPVRIVADSRLRLPLTSKLVASAGETPLWIITVPDNDRDRLKALEDIGVTIIEVTANASGLPEMTEALSALAERGMTRILVEGGSHLQASLIKEGLADRLEWFRASSIIGGDGIPALQSIGLERISDAPELDLIGERRLGRDLLESYFLRN
ncbi:bifunctional diaminohydroxyphosphoribosylaminopyrimidine deaminase/5-amino-6-(5-phosphoribosylamino)uracil reductase RibD [Sneathiella sp.]|jgi:diaminohydroxyphosphoribosylaminopyrimidine deaminase/5-amino-6-(5-phosphoribosylamino)uracil reductase|uniref:bifunctional diaminohydroxyphosphoribosylaminopyrimidine deaminase/5-amino-6-(5-phosphoribosylamino)uracil reductase RibD n=1 Tax=Sneathiella sp. TaxID=1964365 RepID=UPI0025D4E56F|nr:bifunctional diaminohydroxyphosphoribosylaminopyrimidine deaminase/5-amino-6-(5-phosphoribosylamino)uracil reductase RibD [Sneathiella sp.]